MMLKRLLSFFSVPPLPPADPVVKETVTIQPLGPSGVEEPAPMTPIDVQAPPLHKRHLHRIESALQHIGEAVMDSELENVAEWYAMIARGEELLQRAKDAE